jgi:hypothetical protein
MHWHLGALEEGPDADGPGHFAECLLRLFVLADRDEFILGEALRQLAERLGLDWPTPPAVVPAPGAPILATAETAPATRAETAKGSSACRYADASR